MSTPRSVSELYPSKWLKADDLNGRSFILTIERVDLEELHNPQTNKKELKAVVGFGRTKRLCLNKTQCQAIADIAQSEFFEAWPGTVITLSPAVARNGKPTIMIRPGPAPAAGPDFTDKEE